VSGLKYETPRRRIRCLRIGPTDHLYVTQARRDVHEIGIVGDGI
jgi:hypothetical protein